MQLPKVTLRLTDYPYFSPRHLDNCLKRAPGHVTAGSNIMRAHLLELRCKLAGTPERMSLSLSSAYALARLIGDYPENEYAHFCREHILSLVEAQERKWKMKNSRFH